MSSHAYVAPRSGMLASIVLVVLVAIAIVTMSSVGFDMLASAAERGSLEERSHMTLYNDGR